MKPKAWNKLSFSPRITIANSWRIVATVMLAWCAGCSLVSDLQSDEGFVPDMGLLPEDMITQVADDARTLTPPLDMTEDMAEYVAEQPWWDARWSSRVSLRVDVLEQPLGAITLPIEVDTSVLDQGLMQSAGEDLRLVDATGELVPMWVERSPGERLRVWARLSALHEGDTYWLYYGNKTAPALTEDAAEPLWAEGYLRALHFDTQGNNFWILDHAPRARHATIAKLDEQASSLGEFVSARAGSALRIGHEHYVSMRRDDEVTDEEREELSVARGAALTFWAVVRMDENSLHQRRYLWNSDLVCRGLRAHVTTQREVIATIIDHERDRPLVCDDNAESPSHYYTGVVSPPLAVEEARWHVIAVVYDWIDYRLSIYIDEDLAGQRPLDDHGPDFTTESFAPLALGCNARCDMLTEPIRGALLGDLDEFHALDHVVTPEWISARSRAIHGRLFRVGVPEHL